MGKETNFSKVKDLQRSKLDFSKKELPRDKKIGEGTNQAQLGRVKFQDIADQRYQANLEQLRGNKFNADKMMENAKKHKSKLDIERDTLFYRKWK